MQPELEDRYEDVVAKAMRGLGISDHDLSELAKVPLEAVHAATEGHFDESIARKLASALDLELNALVESGKRTWEPDPIALDGLIQVNTAFGGMYVNAYVLWSPASREGLIFDSGGDAKPIIQATLDLGLRIKRILITHEHPDHIADLDSLRKQFPDAPVCIHRSASVPGVESINDNATFAIEGITVEARATPGHSRDGMTFVIHGLERTVAIVGDAIFAGSMGGVAPGVWANALAVNRSRILELPPETVLCPGHGPMTTVGEELVHNPFYARKDSGGNR